MLLEDTPLEPTGKVGRTRSKSLDLRSSARAGARLSLDLFPSTTSKLRRRFSKLSNIENCDIFTISEHDPTASRKVKLKADTDSKPAQVKSAKRRSVKTRSSKIPDISNFPLLLATPEELIAATKRIPSRAKSAPLLKTKSDPAATEAEDRAKEHLKDDEEKGRFKKGGGSNSNNLFVRTVRNHVVADSANFREQRQLERQLKGIQSLQKMNISSINKEKLIILQKSKALPSMLYPDVFTGKKPKCTRRGKCFGTGNADSKEGDSIESGTYLCDPSDGTSPYAEPVKRMTKREASAAWSNAMHIVLRNKPGSRSKKR